ncbi:MAG TPA: hypothetical protein VGI40_13695 [Pirellulaceae bacterium]|jgi:hypothetical protein
MNTEIPADIDLALRKHVERAVRPVRAGADRKLRMREELYGHLTAIYLEELQQRAEPQSALPAAIDRFGDSAALTAELNASLGSSARSEYWEDVANQKMHSWFAFQADQSRLHFVLRWMGALALFNTPAALLLVVALVRYANGGSTDFVMIFKGFSLLILTEPIAIVALRGVFLALGHNHRVVGWLLAIGQAICWSCLEAFLFCAFSWSLVGSVPTRDAFFDVLASFLIGLPPFLLAGGWVCRFAKRNHDKLAAWTSLAIDE